MRITIRDGDKHYTAEVSAYWASRHDNGVLISCGLTVGTDLTRRALRGLGANARPVTKEAYNHSGCQSSCILRGGKTCTW